MTFQSAGGCDVDFWAFLGGKWGEEIASRDDPAADERGSTRVEMAGFADRGGFFLSFCKSLVAALCYGGILCKITPGHPLESTPVLPLAKHSKPAHAMVVFKMNLKKTLKFFIMLWEIK